MRPFMRQEVTIYRPTGEEDDYSKPITVPVISKAHVLFTTKTIKTADGTVYNTFLEVDLPPETIVTYGTELSYKDEESGEVTKGSVVAVEGIRSLTGHKTDYWTVNVA